MENIVISRNDFSYDFSYIHMAKLKFSLKGAPFALVL